MVSPDTAAADERRTYEVLLVEDPDATDALVTDSQFETARCSPEAALGQLADDDADPGVDCLVCSWETLDDGEAFVGAVRSARPALPVLVLFEEGATDAAVERAFAAGATDCVRAVETADPAVLATRLRTALAREQAGRTPDAPAEPEAVEPLEASVAATFIYDDEGTLRRVNRTTGRYFGANVFEAVGADRETVLREFLAPTLAEPADVDHFVGSALAAASDDSRAAGPDDADAGETLDTDDVDDGDDTETTGDPVDDLDGEAPAADNAECRLDDGRWLRRSTHALPAPGQEGWLVDQFVDVTEYKRAAGELLARERHIRELYETTSSTERSFVEKVGRLLELGCDRLGLDIGFLSRIEGDEFELVQAYGDHELLQRGAVDDLSRTYCRHTLGGDGVLTVRNALGEGWTDDPAYERYGLACYLGTKLFVDGELYGTFCFASETARRAPFTETEKTFVELMGTWLSHALEHRHREDQFAALAETSRRMHAAETAEDICRVAVESAEGRLGIPVVALRLYDETTGVLSTVAATPEAERVLGVEDVGYRDDRGEREGVDDRSDAGDTAAYDDAAWRAFADSETVRWTPDADAAEPSPAGGLVVPLSKHGVLVVGAVDEHTLDEVETELASVLAATTQAALDRADRERTLQEHEARLAEQNESLERLNRINGVIRRIDQGLVQASSREEIERVVCDELGGTGPYQFAWIGTYDAARGVVKPQTKAGSSERYLDAVYTDELDEETPAEVAARTGEVQAVEAVFADPPLSVWRQEALRRGYRSVVSLPLAYADAAYGVLTVYSNQPGVFDDLERQVLEELADTVAHAIDAVEDAGAPVGGSAVELEFEVDADEAAPLVQLAAAVDGEVTFRGAVPRSDGSLGCLFAVRGAPTATVLDASRVSAGLRDVAVVAESDDGALFRSTLDEASALSRLLDYGAAVRSLRADATGGRVRVELPEDADVDAFAETLATHYAGAELVARRRREASTGRRLRAEVFAELTDRQREVLQLAYAAGFFKWPRESTAEEVADVVGVSQPTVSRHLRVSERKLLSLLFDDGESSDSTSE